MLGDVILWDNLTRRWLSFTQPVQVISAGAVAEVLPALQAVESAVERQGRYAAGFIAYEAGAAFDPALAFQPPTPLPLLWFGLYHRPAQVEPPLEATGFSVGEWTPSLSQADYARAVRRIKTCIGRGETYQVNFTLRLRATFTGHPLAYFWQLARAQHKGYPAFVDAGRYAICSASPELFFKRDGLRVEMRPMKGTAPRGLTLAEDNRLAAQLADSAKDRAENVMIVDMIRNDLGTVADLGTVKTPRLFEVERYPTVLQMTSAVTAHTEATTTRLLAALFPCASITGAPKVRTTQLIAQLEDSPRGVYTGCIGFLAPGRQAQFNVAIRTVTIDTAAGMAEYGVGSGIVWDSDEADEYRECQTKAKVLTTVRPAFDLLETILWEPADGFFLLDLHLTRLAQSAEYFEIPVDLARIWQELARTAATFAAAPQRVRLLVSPAGAATVEATPLATSTRPPKFKVRLAAGPVDSTNPFLYHKTTHRQVYQQARTVHPDADDVLLWNEHGQITESTIANVVVQFGRKWVTPPVSCGLLAGTFRQHLLAQGAIREDIITPADLERADQVYLINSVRKWIKVTLLPGVGK